MIHAPAAGYIYDVRKIGDIVQKGDEIARIYPDKGSYDNKLSEYVPVNATITGIIRGLIREGYYFKEGFKIRISIHAKGSFQIVLRSLTRQGV